MVTKTQKEVNQVLKTYWKQIWQIMNGIFLEKMQTWLIQLIIMFVLSLIFKIF